MSIKKPKARINSEKSISKAIQNSKAYQANHNGDGLKIHISGANS